jgi:hypothetical protein
MNDTRLKELFHDMLKEMYLASEPPIDIDKIPEGTKYDVKEFYLPEEKYIEIKEKYLKKHKLCKYEKDKIDWGLFDLSPSQCKRGKKDES